MPAPIAIAGIVMGAYNMLKGQQQPPQTIGSEGSPPPQYVGDLGRILSTAGDYMNAAGGIRSETEALVRPSSPGGSDFLGSQPGLGQSVNGRNFYNEFSGGSNLYNSLKKGDNLQFGNFTQ